MTALKSAVKTDDGRFALEVNPEQPMLLRAPRHCERTVAAPEQRG